MNTDCNIELNPIQNMLFPEKPDSYADYFQNQSLERLPTFEVSYKNSRLCNQGIINGLNLEGITCIKEIFERIHPDDVSFVLKFSHKFMRFVLNNLHNIDPMKVSTDIVCRMKLQDHNYHLVRKHTIFNGTKKNRPTHCVTFLEDVSWLRPSNLSWSINGPQIFDHFSMKDCLNISNNLITKREQDILKEVANGLTSIEIAEKLNISKYTVITHRKNIMKKLQTKNMIELLSKASEMGLV